MSDLEFYAWHVFFIVGLVSLPILFHYRKKIIRRLRIMYNVARAQKAIEDRKCCTAFDLKEKIDPWKGNNYR